MNTGRAIFAQLIEHLPIHEFRKCVARYRGNYRTRSFSCWDHFLCMAFAQLTYRESLRDIVACLRSLHGRLYHLGIRGRVSRSTLSDANERRDWRIYADFAHILIREARELYARESLPIDLDSTVYALDSTIIDLCISLFPWAKYKPDQHAVKMHTLLDLRGNIPAFVRITSARMHDVHMLDQLTPEPGAFYVMDRGYMDFERLYRWTCGRAFFVTRAQEELPVSPECFASGGQTDRSAMRSDRVASVVLHHQGLPRAAAAHPAGRWRGLLLAQHRDGRQRPPANLYRLRPRAAR